ncbi:MAG: tetratricopeptide repeat protein [Thermodesulfobacteriota bacterium]|nr:tetratricopeptide repeat protein [Thermodesulfobacteriota bacterium]
MNFSLKIPLFLMIIIFVLSGLTYAKIDNKDNINRDLFETGVHEFKQGRYQQAIDFFTEIIFNGSEKSLVYKNRGIALLNLKKTDLAIKDFEKAVSLDPKLKGIYSNLGSAWHYKKEYKKAIACYDREISNRPDQFITCFNRALSWLGLNQYDNALNDLDQALELKPGFELAISLKNKIYDKTLKKSQNKISLQKSQNKIHGKRVKKDKKGQYTLQIGAFLVKSNSNKKKAALIKRGLEARILSLEDSKKRFWYLVRIGFYESRQKAEKFSSRLRMEYNIDAIIRPSGKF